MSQCKILAFAGSARTASYNKLLVQNAVIGAKESGAEVTYIDLRDFPMPLFDQDLEAAEGLPENARKFKALLSESHGFLIACPEYNSSITPLLKNSLDWASRTETEDEPSLKAFRGKVAAIMSASPGALGGLRGLVVVRAMLSNIGVIVLPDQIAIGAAYEAFEGGKLKDVAKQGQVVGLGTKVAEFARRLTGPLPAA